MSTRNAHWYNYNESRCYPLDDLATCLSDESELLPHDIVADLRLRYPRLLGAYPFVAAVAVTPLVVTVTIQAASTLDNVEGAFAPVAAISLPIAEIDIGRQYALEGQYPGVFGYIVFGHGVQRPFRGRFRTPQQAILSPRAARSYATLPISSMGKLYAETPLTGLVLLKANDPLEVVKECRDFSTLPGNCTIAKLCANVACDDEPSSVLREVIVIRLKGTVEGTTSTFEEFAGPCAKRPDSKNCGDPQPIEYINTVGPDCDGVVEIELSGCAVVGRNVDDCGVIVDCGLGLSEACPPPMIPDDDGILPSEKTPSHPTPPEPPGPEEQPKDSISESIFILGELPYTDCFADFETSYFVTEEGAFTYVIDDSPGDVCLQADSESLSHGHPFTPHARSALAAMDGGARNITLWHGFDETTLYRQVTTDLVLKYGAIGSKHNGGIIVNYRPHRTVHGRYNYYYVSVDYDRQQLRILRFNGVSLQTAIEVEVPSIRLDSWYRLNVKVAPVDNHTVGITARLEDVSSGQLVVTLGPLLVTNYLPDNGLFGVGAMNSATRFSYFTLDEYDPS